MNMQLLNINFSTNFNIVYCSYLSYIHHCFQCHSSLRDVYWSFIWLIFSILLGKSLDKIAELREKGYIKDPTKNKKLNFKRQVAAEVRAQNKKVCLYTCDFLLAARK